MNILHVSPTYFAEESFFGGAERYTYSLAKEVLCNDTREHLDDVARMREEIHRICKPRAKVRIYVTHYSCSNACIDPTHLAV